MNRRGFLGLLGGAAAAVIVGPGSDGYDPDWTEDLWKCVNGHPFCNRCASGVELNEASLEKLCIDIRTSFDGPIAIKPTHILPSPPPRRGLWRA